MQFTIVPADGIVIVNGRALQGIDMSGIPADLHAVQYDSSLGLMEEEWQGDEVNTTFDDHGKYQPIIDRWQAVADLIDNPPPPTKTDALDAMLSEIEDEFNRRADADFDYNGHGYKADYIQIPGMAMNCMILAGTDPIPTADGKWTTTEFEADGATPLRIAFSCAEFIQFAAAFAARRAALFSAKIAHETAVRKIALDQMKTTGDIAGYDFSGGWK